MVVGSTDPGARMPGFQSWLSTYVMSDLQPTIEAAFSPLKREESISQTCYKN